MGVEMTDREKFEQYLLLEQTGELSPRQARELKKTLDQSEDASRLRDEWLTLTAAARDSHLEEEVSAFTIKQIMKEGERHLAPSRAAQRMKERQTPFLALWRPALAYSAIAVVLATVFLFMRSPRDTTTEFARAPADITEEAPSWDDDLDTIMDNLDSMLAAASDDWEEVGSTISQDSDLDIDAIAEELLQLEGVTI